MADLQLNTPAVLIAAGGTGGHVFPALAVAECLRERSVRVQWLGTSRGIEARCVPDNGFDLHVVRMAGVRGKKLRAWIAAPFLVFDSVIRILSLFKRENVGVVLGMGGYVSVAAGLAAVLARKPLILQEQNAVAGSSNRVLAPFAKRIFTGFEGVFGNKKQACWSGNPLRAEFSTTETADIVQSLGEPLNILVVGGSLGASALNRIVPKALAQLTVEGEAGARFSVRHQTGGNDKGQVEAAYEQISMDAEVVEFIDDVFTAYQQADLVIARSGALTVSEIAAVGRAAIFIPYPHAIDDHQTANAKFLVSAGAARLLPQSELNANTLANELSMLLDEPARLEKMARCARQLGKRKAANEVAMACCEYLHER